MSRGEMLALADQAFKTAELLESDAVMDRPYRDFLAKQLRAALRASAAPEEGKLPVAGETREDLQLAEPDGETGEAFKSMAAHIWAAGVSLEDTDFITKMLARKGLYLIQAEPWLRCTSTHCERRAECASPRDCIVKSALSPDSRKAEPVAWRWRIKNSEGQTSGWEVSLKNPEISCHVLHDCEPLYAALTPATEEGGREKRPSFCATADSVCHHPACTCVDPSPSVGTGTVSSAEGKSP